jgi:chromosome segregation protein
MKLKKLEITGFKSFLEKADIHFPPGISAVVGPNGCGKSNIVDALRWVMGEQSVKKLRGKSMEDIIFSGTNGKHPMNMAEVSLILENNNGTAPEELKDFTEIMLTRKLFRSGESAYFINKQPCRLKDIHNIFMGTGVGSKTYAVIEQGNVGAITDAGPEERRLFIEEAAGVTRYKSRKNEALRKVQATNQNLLRVSDIIAEIKRQMNSLKRQAKKAERYKTYQDRIMNLDALVSIHHHDDYLQKIKETDDLLRDLKDEDVEHTSKLKRLDAAVEEIKLKRLEKDQEISAQKSKKFEAQRRIDRMENDLLHLRRDIERLAAEALDLQGAHESLKEKNETIASEVLQVEEQNVSLNSKAANVKLKLESERNASQGAKDRLGTLNQELDAYKAQLLDLVAQEARYNNIYQNAANNKESLNRRLNRIEEETIAADKTVADLSKQEENARADLLSRTRKIKKLCAGIDACRERLDEMNLMLGKQVKLVQSLENERGKARSQYAALKKMEENFEWYKDGVRAIMKQSRTGDDPKDSESGGRTAPDDGILGLMADILEPEPSYGTAVEAVLGESLQYILVKDQETGLRSINYLQTTGAGRSGFVPISSLNPIVGDGQRKSGAANLLLNHVSVKPGFEKIADALLRHVVVVQGLEEALKLFNANGSLQTVVTQNGDVISTQGIMIGGNKDRLSGILAKKRELKELSKMISRLEKDLEVARGRQQDLEIAARDMERDLQQHVEQKNKAVQEETDAEKILYKITEDLKHARRRLEILTLEQDQLFGEESEVNEEIDKYNRALKEVENDVRAAQDRVTETSSRIAGAASEVEAFDQRVVDLKLKLTAINASLENSNNTLRRLKEFKADGAGRLERLAEDISRKHEKKAAITRKVRQDERTVTELYEDMKGLDAALETNETDYQTIDDQLKDNNEVISDIQTRRESILQNIRLLEMEQSQRKIKRDSIAGRIQERYHRSLDSFRQPQAGTPEYDDRTTEEMETELSRLRELIAKIEDVNLGAIKEYEQLKERFDFLTEQRDDLVKAVDDLHRVIRKINRITQERFNKTFNAVNEKLNEVFPRLFEGGSARLVLTQPENSLEAGVEFMVHPPGKKITRMSLLSGGEKALSAIALIFSIYLIKPASFCLMDEIDAPLDEANIFRFNNLLQLIGEKSQIIMITHNKRTMEFADTLFGVTMEQKGISKIVSVDFQRTEAAA